MNKNIHKRLTNEDDVGEPGEDVPNMDNTAATKERGPHLILTSVVAFIFVPSHKSVCCALLKPVHELCAVWALRVFLT